MEGFIEAMDQLGKSIEVFVNANELVAKTYLESFDKLLDVYAKIGEAMPGLMMYQSTFENYPPLAAVLEDYYSDILRFHEEALGVFTRPKWKTLFKSIWKTFDTRFKPILDSLNRRRELLESEKGSAALHEISESRGDIAALSDELMREASRQRLEKHKWRLAHVKEKLEATEYHLDQEMACEDRSGSSSGSWLLSNPAFKKWADRSTTEHRILYLNGIPGAGE
ncbi:hypothetical protein Daus18300_004594 [Diaporthe australafricana]|uniref:Uncharacterized protein n=1 Tax=Diaporthe australafricana TaxID=127596 RepID=A0ABR3X8E8_9PEZI